ncbi:MAG: quinone oxidoreductase [Deltaproteobacteria bacterium]|nr:quinone oxidoreductase [Deltaproteobacteria bacterium]
MNVKAIVVNNPGGPEALELRDRELPEPAPGQVRVRLRAIGVNYVDVYHREGRYPIPPPFTPGSEGAGVVEALGPNVEGVKVGDKVAYAMELGAYAEAANVHAWRLVPLPDGLEFEKAAAALLQGMTAKFLVDQTYPVQRGDFVLVHAASGGVGLWLCAMAKERGATVIGTVGSEEKAALAKKAGADHAILYRSQDVATEVARLTGGKKCAAVYDGVGKDTFAGSLDSLRPRGVLALFGMASGAVPPFDLGVLAQKGSLFITRPSLRDYAHDRASTLALGTPVFQGVRDGRYALHIDRALPLADAAQAHKLLEGRATRGKLILTVS